jgi:hypothetical protein
VSAAADDEDDDENVDDDDDDAAAIADDDEDAVEANVTSAAAVPLLTICDSPYAAGLIVSCCVVGATRMRCGSNGDSPAPYISM